MDKLVNRTFFLCLNLFSLSLFAVPLDQAEETFEEVLTVDPYNQQARKGLEVVSNKKSRYYQKAKAEGRAFRLSEVDAEWVVEDDFQSSDPVADEVSEQSTYVQNRVDANSVTYRSLVFDEEYLEDVAEELRRGTAADGGSFSIVVMNDVADKEISLQLNEVSLENILEVLESNYDVIHRIDGQIITLGSTDILGKEFGSRTWLVPSSVIQSLSDSAQGSIDPFASSSTKIQPKSVKMKNLLKENGVEFPEGSSVMFNSGSRALSVYAPIKSLGLVDDFIFSQSKTDKISQVAINAKIIEVQTVKAEEFGIEWFVQDVVGEGLRLNGASDGSISAPISFGSNASGSDALTTRMNDGAQAQIPGVFSISQRVDSRNANYRALLRGLNQRTDSDTLVAPRIVLKSGTTGTLSVIDEMYYPASYEPPQVPQNANANNNNNVNDLLTNGIGGGSSGVITPANPTDFTVKELGVTLEVTATVNEDTGLISLELAPEYNMLLGFIDYGSDIGFGETAQPNEILQPVFKSISSTSSIDILSGQSVVMAGYVRSQKATLEENLPLFSWVPVLGKAFSSNSKVYVDRYLLITVDATILNPQN